MAKVRVRSPQFGIGQLVVPKKTGLPVIGMVPGVIDATFYANHLQHTNVLQHYTTWYELYPKWHNSWIYFVSFAEPQRTCTFEEWRNGHIKSDHSTYQEYELTIEKYEEVCAKHIAAMYPQDDLEAADPDQTRQQPDPEDKTHDTSNT
jgi:hypothetical protein